MVPVGVVLTILQLQLGPIWPIWGRFDLRTFWLGAVFDLIPLRLCCCLYVLVCLSPIIWVYLCNKYLFYSLTKDFSPDSYEVCRLGRARTRSRVLWEQDSSPTRQFTDTYFGDSSPTHLKTVHRHFWRRFTDTFGDSSPTHFIRMLMSIDILFHTLTVKISECLYIIIL